MKTKRRNITITPQVEEAIKTYQNDHGITSWNEAILRLALMGLGVTVETNMIPKWGRKGKHDA